MKSKRETKAPMQCSRELPDRHLLVIAEAEEKGHQEIADLANELWRLHECGMTHLESWLQEVRQ